VQAIIYQQSNERGLENSF